MKKIIFLFLFFLSLACSLHATHNRAGEITYRVLNCDTRLYEITITTYTKTSSEPADRPVLDSVHLGDDNVVSITRFDIMILPNDVKRNRYIINHAYAAAGRYKIWFIDPNRVENIVNMIGSVDVPFYLETILIINPFDGCNSSPVLTYPPIDRGCINKLFIHNPVAVDPDGDSLSYQLTVPKMAPSTPVPGYFLPPANNSFTLNPVTGDLIWDTPQAVGEYNVAFYIIEWRNGHRIDSVTRDMQITILNCNNNPPVISSVKDTCIFAGDALSFSVTATDPDGNNVSLTAYGAPFTVTDPATFSSTPPSDTVTGIFNWNTQCHHIRLQPYSVVFRAQDNSPEVQLVDLEHVNIRVIAPPPQGLTATPAGNTILLNWLPGACATDSGYRIWRRNGQFNGTFNCPCETGVPASSGFTLIGTVYGNLNTTFTDFTQLVIGIEYCYVVTVFYSDGSESCPSNEACAKLKKDLPVIINASVLSTSTTTGQVYVAWSKPIPPDLDTSLYPPPYKYKLYHYPDFTRPNATPDTLVATFSSIDDTTYYDTLLNTVAHPYSYRVEFYYDSAEIYAGETQRASTVYLSIAPTDEQLNLSWHERVPWTNHFYEVFRYNNQTTNWDSIGRAFTQSFSDTNLINGVSYCYYVKSVGTYSAPGYDTTRNNSQEKCAEPYDNVPPCSPHVAVSADCIANANFLAWNNPNNSCADDVMGYYIYYHPAQVNDYVLLDSVLNANDTSYIHSGLQSIAGCYYVTAFDTNRNESTDYVPVCIDTCYQYYLPNVFSPDGSGLNDLLHPCDLTTAPEMQIKCPPYQNVKDVNLKFFNRWGEIVFETTDRDINWNGKHKDNGKDCPDGVYYYTGIVNFISLSGDISKDLHGFVHLIRKK
ncbi:MAG TPA: gliding motility-associated C-terminal domain-containing protein [Bacteroidia bacterium]|nr:gliding motility-associated C-terminal domain-containing protein [Bacteroidia bacterium]